jgi:transcriptional regulator with XRE-family HTH domain
MDQDQTAGDVGARVHELRCERNWSEQQLARAAGITKRQLMRIEQGRAPATPDEVLQIACALGVHVADLTATTEPLTIVASPASGSSHKLTGAAAYEALLREYLSMVFELRNVTSFSHADLRQRDLTELSRALGETPRAIEARIAQLLDTDAEGAAGVRSTLAPSSTRTR